MVKHTQKIRRQEPTNCLDVFDDFARFALKGLTWSTFVSNLSIIHPKMEEIWKENWRLSHLVLMFPFHTV